MPVTERTGNIFTTQADVLVNTVNCAGVMGAGIALEIRRRYPDLFAKYVKQCELGMVAIGNLDIYRSTDPWILNFPTKTHWRLPTKIDYVRAGLEAFVRLAGNADFHSIAFPLLGASHGGLDPEQSRATMLKYLSSLPLEIEIWHHDPHAEDDLIAHLREIFNHETDKQISAASGLSSSAIRRVRAVIPRVTQIAQISDTPGLGETSIDRLFAFAMTLKHQPARPWQSSFDIPDD